MLSAGFPIYEYHCSTCNSYYEESASVADYNKPIPCTCGDYAERIIASAPAIVGSDYWSDTKFNPHYDAQLGKYFGTKEEKLNYLKSKDLTQTSGSLSPRTSTLGATKCNQAQAELLDTKEIGQSDLSKKITSGHYISK